MKRIAAQISRNFFYALTLAAGLLSACEDLPFERDPVAVREYTIGTGEHYSTPKLLETTGLKHMAFRATFDSSARYTLSDPTQQSNINKLMGFSDCSTHHHTNSARFGWRWYNGRLEIHAYCYADSVRVHQYIGTVNIGEENLYEITATTDAYDFSINGEENVSIPRAESCNGGMNYLLYPYFGGSVPAPHEVRIKIEMVD